jgi:drug/metabolite transporter (DMT)-like permease
MAAVSGVVTAQRRSRLDGVAVAIVLACCVLWGINQVPMKIALTEVPPLLQAGVRSLASALLVFGYALVRKLPLFERDGTLPGGLLAGALFAAEFACIFVGLQYTTASRMVVFVYLARFVVARGWPFIALAERLAPLPMAGLVAAFGGVAWAFAEGFAQHAAAADRQWVGDALGVLAALLWGSTTLVIRASRLSTAAPEKTLLYQLAGSGVLLLAAGLLTGESWPASLSTPVTLSLAFQIVVICFASYLTWFWLIRHYPATQLSSFTLLTPIAGLLAGAFWLGETVTLRLLVALATVSLGIWLVNRAPRRGPAS